MLVLLSYMSQNVIYRMARNLVERYFGELLKICHLVEVTLGVEPVLAIMIVITKWPIERTGFNWAVS